MSTKLTRPAVAQPRRRIRRWFAVGATTAVALCTLAATATPAQAFGSGFSGGGYGPLYYTNTSPSNYCQEVHWTVLIYQYGGGSTYFESWNRVGAWQSRLLDTGFIGRTDEFGTRSKYVSGSYVLDRYGEYC